MCFINALLLTACRRCEVNGNVAERRGPVQSVTRGNVKTVVMRHQNVAHQRHTEAAVTKRRHVDTKKGYCEICQVYYKDMDAVRLLMTTFRFTSLIT